MVKKIIDDSEHTIIEIIHYIPEYTFDMINLPKEEIINAEIELMEKELKEYYPLYHLVYSYPQRKLMVEPKNENYEKAIHELVDMGICGKVLRVVTRAVRYY